MSSRCLIRGTCWLDAGLARSQARPPELTQVHAPEPGEGGLVERPEVWRWSSSRDYLLEEKVMVEVD